MIASVEPNRRLRQEIERHMRRERITQAELARRLGMSPQYLSDVLTGRRSRLPRSLEKVLEALELEIELRPQARSEVVPRVPPEIQDLIDSAGAAEIIEGRGKPTGSRLVSLRDASLGDAVVAERDEREECL
jgi:transcriptional regulator with XRE-family HTH domain